MSEAQPEIIALTFAEPVTASTQVRKLLGTIEHYRAAGRSVREIHTALIAGGHLSNCSQRTFEKIYYRIRKESSKESE